MTNFLELGERAMGWKDTARPEIAGNASIYIEGEEYRSFNDTQSRIRFQ